MPIYINKEYTADKGKMASDVFRRRKWSPGNQSDVG